MKDTVFDNLIDTEMLPLLDFTSREPLFMQIYQFFKEAILSKKMLAGTTLPSIRKLANDLELSNNTVISAYQQLIDEGYIQHEERRRLRVRELDEGLWLHQNQAKGQKPINRDFKKTSILFNPISSGIDEESFPLKEWRKALQQALDQNQYQYGHSFGEKSLKIALSQFLYASRGVVSTEEQLVIGSGTNFLISLLVFILDKKELKVIFEEPGYEEIRNTFLSHGAAINPIAVHEEGIDLQKLQELEGDLLYISPSHQYPKGVSMPVKNRIQALQWAGYKDCLIIEDDYDSEFRYKGHPIPSLQGMDKEGRVIYMGTFSKAFMPSLRMAYMVLPIGLLHRLERLKQFSQTVPWFTQRAMAILIENGIWEKHLRKMRSVYRKKYYTMYTLLKEIFTDKIYFSQSDSGLNFYLEVGNGLSEGELIQLALEAGIQIKGTQPCWYHKENPTPGFLLGFGNIREDRMEEMVTRLHNAWF